MLIGAGSTVFTTGLVSRMMGDGNEWDIGFVDIDREALDVSYQLAEKMLQARPAPITLKKSTERKELLPGADIVVTTIAVGGRAAWLADVTVPRKYGVFQAVGDTIMPGGLSRALRMIPPMVDIAEDVSELCPDAVFVNYSNPMSAIVRALRKQTKSNVIGLCGGTAGVARYLARFLGVDPGRCESLAVGINHLTWLVRYRIDGADAYPAIREKNEEIKRQGKLAGDDPDNQLSWELFEAFDCFSVTRDRHTSEFFPQFHRDGKHYGKTLGVDRFSIEGRIQEGDKDFERMKRIACGKEAMPQKLLLGDEGDFQVLIPLLNAFERDEPQIFHVNVPNTGQVTNLSREFVLDCPVNISTKGPEPVQLGELPTGIRATVEKSLLSVELAVEAALERDRKKFVQALALDGSVSSMSQANALADELIEAHRQYLPGW